MHIASVSGLGARLSGASVVVQAPVSAALPKYETTEDNMLRPINLSLKHKCVSHFAALSLSHHSSRHFEIKRTPKDSPRSAMQPIAKAKQLEIQMGSVGSALIFPQVHVPRFRRAERWRRLLATCSHCTCSHMARFRITAPPAGHQTACWGSSAESGPNSGALAPKLPIRNATTCHDPRNHIGLPRTLEKSMLIQICLICPVETAPERSETPFLQH